jgi:O-antigen ligase/tetratricopeptide (TPR) repeat protein
MNARFLKKIILIGIFSIPFIALFSTDLLFFGFVTAKAFVFRTIVEIIFGAWIILLLYDKSSRPKFSIILLSILIFMGVIALADFLGQDPYKSFWGNFERMEGLISHLHLLAFFLVSTSLLTKRELWEKFFLMSIWVSSTLSFIGILQMIHIVPMARSDMRLDLAFGNPLFLAAYISLHIFLLIWFLQKREHKKLYWALLVINLMALYGTASRGAMLALAIGVFIYVLVLLIIQRSRRLFYSLLILIGFTVLFSGGVFLARNTSFVQNSPVLSRFVNSAEFIDSGSNSRIFVWQIAWQGFKERPILGWGQENFSIVFNKHYNPSLTFAEPWFDRAHNIVLDWLIAGGFLGLLSYLFLVSSGPLTLWRRKENEFAPEEKALFSALFTAYFIQNLVVFDTIISYIMLFSVLGFLHSQSIGERTHGSTETPFRYIAMPIIIGAIILLVYIVNIKPFIQNYALRQAVTEPNLDTTGNFNQFKKGLSINTFGNREFREELSIYTSNLARDENTYFGPSIDDFANIASAEMEKYLENHPDDVKALAIYGGMLGDVGQYDKALIYLNRARELSPNKEDILSAIAAIKIRAGYYNEAVEDFKLLYELADTLPKTSRYMRYIDIEFNKYAASLIYNGQKEEAEKLLEERYGTKLVAEDQIINAYADTGRHDIVVKLWQKRTGDEPDNPQHLVSLAASYLAIGQNNSAISTIRKAYTIDPAFKEQGEEIIKDIEAGRIFDL